MTETTTGPVDEELVRELAQVALEQRAPDELLLFDETAEEYFADPEGVLAAGGRDEPVGFGLEMAMVTPVVLAVVTPVVKFLLSVAADTLKEQAKPVLADWVRGLFHKGRGEATTPVAALTVPQAQRARQLMIDRAMQLRMERGDAELLADSVIGGMAVA